MTTGLSFPPIQLYGIPKSGTGRAGVQDGKRLGTTRPPVIPAQAGICFSSGLYKQIPIVIGMTRPPVIPGLTRNLFFIAEGTDSDFRQNDERP